MTLERLANRTPPGDPADVLDAARARAESRPAARRPPFLAAAAAVIAIVALAAGAFALTGDDDTESVTVAGPDDSRSVDDLDGLWNVVSTVDDGDRQQATGTANLRFDGDRVQGDDGCNNRINATVKNGVIGPVSVRTQVGCPDDAATEEADLFWAGLGHPVELHDGELWLVADDGDGLVFARPDSAPTESASAGDAPNTNGGLDGPVMYAPASHSDRMEFAQLTGVLGREGDCLFLYPPPNARDLTVETLLWPYGATWEDDPAGVRLADGTFVPVGAQFTAAGGIHDIDGLTGQGHHPDVADRARKCDQQSASRENVDVVAYVQGQFEVTGVPDAPTEGDTAVWDVDAADPPTPSATSVTALVTRLGCNGGVTGEVLEPEVSADGEQVVVTFSVEPVPGGTCPGNDSVPYVVELGGPLGDRELVDGACLSGEAALTSFCSEGAVRWSPPA